MITEQKLVVG